MGSTELGSFIEKLQRERGDTHVVGDDVCEFQYDKLLDVLPKGKAVAIRSVEGDKTTSFARLHKFVSSDFNLAQFGVNHGDRCALVLPNTAENAVCVFATSCYSTCVPLHLHSTPDEVEFEMENTNCAAVIIFHEGDGRAAGIEAAARLKVPVIELKPRQSDVGLFDLACPKTIGGRPQPSKAAGKKQLNQRGDNILVLHTSGTSGKKKAVPYTAQTLVVGAGCIGASWGLKSTDCCLIIMPLCHIGGLARNIYSVLFTGGSSHWRDCHFADALSPSILKHLLKGGGCSRMTELSPTGAGGSLICVESFTANPDQFWEICTKQPVTWYYGGPTFHQMILDSGRSNFTKQQRSKVRTFAPGGCGCLPQRFQ